MNKSLKIGDKVRIISLREITRSPKVGFIESMKKYCGKEATIKHRVDFDGEEYYKIDLDDQLFIWGSDMFEGCVKNLLRNE